VVDYHYGYNFEGSLRIKSLAVDDTLVEFNQQVHFYSAIENAASAVAFNWYVDGVLSPVSSDDFNWMFRRLQGSIRFYLKFIPALHLQRIASTLPWWKTYPSLLS
jgi:hypothetical protein